MWKGGKIAMIENANDKPQSLLKAESDLEREERILPTCDEKNIYKVEFDSINDALLNLEEKNKEDFYKIGGYMKKP